MTPGKGQRDDGTRHTGTEGDLSGRNPEGSTHAGGVRRDVARIEDLGLCEEDLDCVISFWIVWGGYGLYCV